MRLMRTLTFGLATTVVWFFVCCAAISAQENNQNADCRPIGPEDTSSTPAAIRALPYCSPTMPVKCEEVLFYLDHLAARAHKTKPARLFIIARLGRGEKSEGLNRRRLLMVKTYLADRLAEVEIITASGDHVGGYGRLEFYLDGSSFSMPYGRNHIASCKGLG